MVASPQPFDRVTKLCPAAHPLEGIHFLIPTILAYLDRPSLVACARVDLYLNSKVTPILYREVEISKIQHLKTFLVALGKCPRKGYSFPPKKTSHVSEGLEECRIFMIHARLLAYPNAARDLWPFISHVPVIRLELESGFDAEKEWNFRGNSFNVGFKEVLKTWKIQHRVLSRKRDDFCGTALHLPPFKARDIVNPPETVTIHMPPPNYTDIFALKRLRILTKKAKQVRFIFGNPSWVPRPVDPSTGMMSGQNRHLVSSQFDDFVNFGINAVAELPGVTSFEMFLSADIDVSDPIGLEPPEEYPPGQKHIAPRDLKKEILRGIAARGNQSQVEIHGRQSLLDNPSRRCVMMREEIELARTLEDAPKGYRIRRVVHGDWVL